jgi:hypothetical protein
MYIYIHIYIFKINSSGCMHGHNDFFFEIAHKKTYYEISLNQIKKRVHLDQKRNTKKNKSD